MIKLRLLTQEGIEAFRSWLAGYDGSAPPASLISGDEFSEVSSYDIDIDPVRIFQTRYEFGQYLADKFSVVDLFELLDAKNDGLWDWLAAVYFGQLVKKKISREEHYIVARFGGNRPLVYRHSVRTSYQLVKVHGERARVCLTKKMDTFGDLAEQMTSRQYLAMHTGFMDTAYTLYFQDGRLRPKSSTRVKPVRKRKPGDRTGFGGAGRLALVLQRVDLTYDTESMRADALIPVLPKEFARWSKAQSASSGAD